MQVIGLRDVIPPPLRREFSDVYIATELMDTDLHQIIRSNQGLSEDHCQVNSPPSHPNAFMDAVFIVFLKIFKNVTFAVLHVSASPWAKVHTFRACYS